MAFEYSDCLEETGKKAVLCLSCESHNETCSYVCEEEEHRGSIVSRRSDWHYKSPEIFSPGLMSLLSPDVFATGGFWRLARRQMVQGCFLMTLLIWEALFPSARFHFRQLFRYSVRYYGATLVTFCTAPNTIVAVVLLIQRAVDRWSAVRSTTGRLPDLSGNHGGGCIPRSRRPV